jgi:hypothetical protein
VSNYFQRAIGPDIFEKSFGYPLKSKQAENVRTMIKASN